MISAVVLLNTDINASQDGVLKSIKQVKGVQEAHSLFGVYDLLVKVQAASIDELKNITKTYKRVAGVISSFTLMIDDHQDTANLSASLTGI